jgi:hypothetical protein
MENPRAAEIADARGVLQVASVVVGFRSASEGSAPGREPNNNTDEDFRR